MAEGVVMPKAGITVESCIISQWKKNVGDTVNVGDILFSYETDKAEFECESTAAGEILAIYFQDGDEVPCLVNVCAIGTKGDDISALQPEGAAEAAPAAPAAEAAPAAAAAPEVKAEAPAATAVVGGDVKVSPRARGLAEKAGVDAALATATGPNGRIIERDVRKLMAEGVPAAAAEAAAPVAGAAAPVAAPETEYEDIKFNAVRKATSKAMMNSLSTTAQLTLNFSFDATQLQAYRKMLKELDAPMGKISLNDMVLFAVSRTVLSFPDVNANMIDDTTVRQFKHVNLGFACDTPKGLLVPVIRNADQKSLLDISLECKALAAEAKDGKLGPDALAGGTFTVSNLGSMGVESFTPVINPPQTGILGVCNIQTKIKGVKDGVVQTYPAMGLSYTFDHRVLDGAPAARFMQALCKNLENFMTLLAK